MRWTEQDFTRLLQAKYTKFRVGEGTYHVDRYVRARQVRYPHPGYSGDALRIADYMVMDTYASGKGLMGFEIKVQRSDWLKELKDPSKAEIWKQHCDHWYLACPPDVAQVTELPPGWGLITLQKDGTLRVKKDGGKLKSKPMSNLVLGQYVRAVSKTTEWENKA